jgi:hypothetical protein
MLLPLEIVDRLLLYNLVDVILKLVCKEQTSNLQTHAVFLRCTLLVSEKYISPRDLLNTYTACKYKGNSMVSSAIIWI